MLDLVIEMPVLERPRTVISRPELTPPPSLGANLFGVPVSASELAKLIDHTLLDPAATDAEIAAACDDAARLGCKGMCVNAGKVSIAARRLAGSRLEIVATVGFPFGTSQTWVKLEEACLAVRDGATEIDMVVNIGALRSGHDAVVRDDIKSIVQAVWPRPVKVIIEAGKLIDEEKRRATEIAVKAGAAFVKTSTGFLGRGATIHDVELISRVAAGRVQVKAAGGIRSLQDALAMIEAGATRLGISHTADVLAPLGEPVRAS